MNETPRVTEVVARLKNVFMEDPGTRVSARDASRLAGIDALTCDVILQTLEDAQFLRRRPDGLFTRR